MSAAEFGKVQKWKGGGPNEPSLTDRQAAVLGLIKSFIAANGYAPTIRELAKLTGIGSTNGVTDHLKALERKGFITHNPKQSRTLRVCKEVAA